MITDHKANAQTFIMNTYRRYPLTLVKGKGSYVYDEDGKKYLDFIAGIAVCNLGHCPKELRRAIERQAGRLVHTSNLFYTLPQIELAELLVNKCSQLKTRGKRQGARQGAAHASRLTSNGHSGWKVFFCNSGAEANEGAIKLARKYHRKKGHDRFEIITFYNSFHGRTYGALSATAQEKFHKGFEPMLPGFRYVPFNDIEAVKNAVNQNTAAIMMELVQAEGGVNMCDPAFLNGIRELCEKNDILLILDEVQTGMGRTGKLFAHEHFDFQPDIFTLAKGIAGGLPMGVMLAKNSVAAAFEPGSHASTFGGGPLVSAVALNVLGTITKSSFLADVRKKGEYLTTRLNALKKKFPICDVRGMGLLIGIEIDVKEPVRMVEDAMREGLLINLTAERVVRLVPPLTVSKKEMDKFLYKFETVLEGVTG